MVSTFRASGLSPLRVAILGYCLLIYSLIAMGALSTQRIGAMAWGPTTDFWAAAIAISDIELGMGGGLGRRELSFAQAKVLSLSGSDKAVHDDETRRRVYDPTLVTKAFQDAAAIDPASLERLPLDSEMFVTTVFEDIGYADFYGIAFRLFGYDASSTYKLYMSLLGFSVVLFMAAQWRSPLGLSVLALALSGLFVMSTSIVFSGPIVPSFAANRALGTLAMLPALCLLVSAFDQQKATWLPRLAMGLQILLFAFAISLRTSVVWAVIALAIILVAVICARAFVIGRGREHGNFLSTFFHAADTRKAIYLLSAALIAATGYSAIRNSQLHFLYDTDDVLPHHLRWHSAYIALLLHPDHWKHPDFFGTEGETGDNVAWGAYRRYMSVEFPNTPERSKVTGSNKSRLHDHVMKERFIAFAKNNPSYIFDLYLYYKTKKYVVTIWNVLASVPVVSWVISLPALILFGLSLVASRRRSFRYRTMPAIGILLICSFAPFIWAYAGTHTIFDHFVILIVVAFMLVGWAASALFTRWIPAYKMTSP